MRGKIKELLGHILLTLFVSVVFAAILVGIIYGFGAIMTAIFSAFAGG